MDGELYQDVVWSERNCIQLQPDFLESCLSLQSGSCGAVSDRRQGTLGLGTCVSQTSLIRWAWAGNFLRLQSGPYGAASDYSQGRGGRPLHQRRYRHGRRPQP